MEKVWYYMKKDKSKYGPYSDNELCALIHQGIIDANEWLAEGCKFNLFCISS